MLISPFYYVIPGYRTQVGWLGLYLVGLLTIPALNFLILCVWVFCLHLCLHITGSPGGQMKVTDPLEPGIRNGCESLFGCWELKPNPLEEHHCSFPGCSLSSPKTWILLILLLALLACWEYRNELPHIVFIFFP